MDIFTARQMLRGSTIYELPMRVTFYARVSSESDEQLNSLGNQIQYYQEMIRKNEKWEYVEGYVDEGLSAATTKKRENFHRMIEDAKKGLFDFVVTKEITRFARNTLDSIRYTRELLSAGVGVFFQNDNIITLDEDSELRLTIMSGIAQDELRKLSSRVKFGHQQAIKNKVVLGNSRIFGYRKDKGRLVIEPEEAQMVRELFEMYSTGQYSMKQLEAIFWDRGYRNLNGNRIVHSTMANVIANPKYKGYYVGNKVKVIDLFSKKQKFLPPEEWVIFKDEGGEIVPAIVDEALWEQANAILRRRSVDVKQHMGVYNHQNLMTGKLYCVHCGKPYYRRAYKDRFGVRVSRWVCSGKLNNGAESCPSVPIYESELKTVLLGVFKDTKDNTEAAVTEYMEMFPKLHSKKSTEKQERVIFGKIDVVEKKKQKLLMYNATGKLSDDDFLAMNKKCSEELKKYQDELAALQEEAENSQRFQEKMADIFEVLRDAEKDIEDGIVTLDFMDKYIEKIFVSVDKFDLIHLEIVLFAGEHVEETLGEKSFRMGQMRKKMWRVRNEKEFEIPRKSRNCDGHMVTMEYKAEVFVREE